MTDAERALWRLLRESFPEQHFRRQVPIRQFIADFASHRARIVIEVDGGQHKEAVDAARTRIIEDEGYRVVRFWNHDVLGNRDGVWTIIDTALRECRTAVPLPLMGRGRGGVTPGVERGSGITPTQPSPIEGKG